jgi:transposase
LKYETEEEYKKRVLKWEASLPHDVKDPKPQGNLMTQKYYTERLLSYYIEKLQKESEHGCTAILQEDNDSSHGIRSKNNVARKLKEANSINTLYHPAQSPDLSPIEGIWNILKQRVRKRYNDWRTFDELKRVILEEWDKITLHEIRKRIAEMPARCEKLVATGGERIRSKVW